HEQEPLAERNGREQPVAHAAVDLSLRVALGVDLERGAYLRRRRARGDRGRRRLVRLGHLRDDGSIDALPGRDAVERRADRALGERRERAALDEDLAERAPVPALAD